MPIVTIIYNPLAGPADLGPVMDQIAERWRDGGWEAFVQPTEAVNHATTLAVEAVAAGHQLVLAAGGDGTLGEVVNGLAGSDTIMGIIPVGTANSFARELNIPIPGLLEMQAATVLQNGILGKTKDNKLLAISDELMAGHVQQMDLGWKEEAGGNGRHWMLWASVGADGYLVHELEPRPKWAKKIGRASYVLRGVPILTRYSHVHAKVEVDGHFFEDDFILVLVSNSRRYAGGLITLTKEAYLDDGQFEIWLFGGRGFPSITRHALRALQGKHLQQSDAFLVHGRHVVIHTDPPAPLQMDGDPVGQTPLKCRIKPKALRLLVPKATPTDLFQFAGTRLEDLVD